MDYGIGWNEDYRLGIDRIDDQHIRLFDIVKRIAALDASTSNKSDLKRILGELSDYLREHFTDEEEFMTSIGYPDLDYHHNLHQDIIAFINTSITNSPTIAMIQTKLKFIIKKALIDHIVLEDTKIKAYVVASSKDACDDCIVILA